MDPNYYDSVLFDLRLKRSNTLHKLSDELAKSLAVLDSIPELRRVNARRAEWFGLGPLQSLAQLGVSRV
jgi:hypothetical protein